MPKPSRVGIRTDRYTEDVERAINDRQRAYRRFQRQWERDDLLPRRPVLEGRELARFKDLLRTAGLTGNERHCHRMRVERGMSPESIAVNMREHPSCWQVRVWLTAGADKLDAMRGDLYELLILAAQPLVGLALRPRVSVPFRETTREGQLLTEEQIATSPAPEAADLAEAWLMWILGERPYR